ncbi:group III truncated hemoglobin [Xanthobacter sp. TB0136]|uniref:group III truncated hemoglobin n=1 Tax=Xanthobacter sp. TB0136 TaxID=3459177 RepID=UPI00403A2700
MSIPGEHPGPPPKTAVSPEVQKRAEQAIHDLVHGFYDEVRSDPLIGPVFNAHIASAAWPEHLARMCDFWSSVILRSGRYNGRPLPPHLALGTISDEQFARWLALFRPVARRTLPPVHATRAIQQAERMADSFRMSMAFQRGDDITGMKPLPREPEADPNLA